MTIFAEKIYRVVQQIPRGQTRTYKEIARLAGRPKAYRVVGTILHKNPDLKRIPCHRVVRSDGRAGGYLFGTKQKIALLCKEGATQKIVRSARLRKSR